MLNQLLNATERVTFIEDFTSPINALNTTDNWEIIAPISLTQSLVIANSLLTLGAGTDANNQFVMRTKQKFNTPMRLQVSVTLSQRIANNAFYIELVNDLDDCVLGWLWDGTVVTQAKILSQNKGPNSNIVSPSAAITVLTSATTAIFEIDFRADGVEFADRVVDSNTVNTIRATRTRGIPTSEEEYRIRIRSVNGAVAPASNTNFIIDKILLQDMTKFVVEVSAGRGNQVINKAIPMSLVHAPATVPVSLAATSIVQLGPTVSATALTPYKVLTPAATTNPALIITGAHRFFGWNLYNASGAVRYMKLYNKATAPVPGTDVPLFSIPLAPGNNNVNPDIPIGTFALGLGVAFTTGSADLDTGAVAIADVIGTISYI